MRSEAPERETSASYGSDSGIRWRRLISERRWFFPEVDAQRAMMSRKERRRRGDLSVFSRCAGVRFEEKEKRVRGKERIKREKENKK